MADEIHLLAGLYAVDALEGEELATFEAHLATCAECQAEVAQFTEVTAEMADGSATAPPASARAAVLARIADTPQDPPVPAGADVTALDDRRSARDAAVERSTAERRPRRVGRWVVGIAAALVLVAGAVGAGVVFDRLSTRADDAEAITALVARDDAQTIRLQGEDHPSVNVVYSPSQGRAAVVADGLDRLPDDKTYELWAIRDGVPAKAGLFNADADGTVRTTLDGNLSDASALAVTVEPAGGSDQPTSDIILSS